MSDTDLFNAYLKDLHAAARRGDAREESFYPALAGLLKARADATGSIATASASRPFLPPVRLC